jgi:hydroxyacylglutathione hydrolase
MKLYTVKSEGLAHNSYFLSDGQEAVVIDPRRDCQTYLNLAKKECAKICYIFETHRNEDYAIGSLELQDLSHAEIAHSKQLAFKYGEHNLEDNETLNVGKLKIQILYTPGHTNESVCYVVSNLERSAEPLMVFTGDTLFVGSVGRTDLLGEERHAEQAAKLYESLHERLFGLGDGVLIYPAHGSGSLCGSQISQQPTSTIGYEKKANPYLTLNKDAFIQRALATQLLVPPYFAKMEQYNLKGAPQLKGLPLPKALEITSFEDTLLESDSVVVDTRLPNAFAGAHIPGSLNIPLGGLSVYPGWVVDYAQRILLVVERKVDLARALRSFWRLGYDNVYGYLCSGMNRWQEAGKAISHFGTLSAAELYVNRHRFVVLDVREPSEWVEGIIEDAQLMYFGDLPQKADALSRNKRYAIVCSVGTRASIAASLLKQKGFEVSNVLGGMMAWNKLGYPTVKPPEQVPVIAQ